MIESELALVAVAVKNARCRCNRFWPYNFVRVETGMIMPGAPKNPKPWIAFAACVGLLGAAWGIAEWRMDPRSNLRHPAIIDTGYFAFALYAGSVLLQLQATRGEWSAGSTPFLVARAAWIAGLGVFLIHLFLAFQLAHDWSHSRAVAHVEATSGFGPGIFVSYFFALSWLIDASIWTWSPIRYANRPRWLAIAWHAFAAFIWFNATVVYASSPLRWIALVVFALVAGQWLKNQLRETSPEL